MGTNIRGREIYARQLPLEQSLAVADILDASEQTYFQLYSGMDLISTHKAVKRIYDCELPVGYAEAAVKKMVLVPNLREYLEKTGKPRRHTKKAHPTRMETGRIRLLFLCGFQLGRKKGQSYALLAC